MIAIRIAVKATIGVSPLVAEPTTYPGSVGRGLRLWLVDPIAYSGMAYSDAGQIEALGRLGIDATLVGTDESILDPGLIPMLRVFRGTSGARSRWRKGSAYLLSLVRLLRAAAVGRPDVIHWQYSELPVADMVTILALRMLRVPQAYTAHELLPWTARRHHPWVFRRIYRAVDRIVVHNESQRQELIGRFRVDADRVVVAPLGDYALFADDTTPQTDARRSLGLESSAPIALFFGSIRASKGLEDLIDGWRAVSAALPDARLLIVGKPILGTTAEDIISWVDQAGLNAAIRMVLTQVDTLSANAYYRSADVVVLPYRSVGTSGVLRYAFDSGRPVVATAVGEHPTHVLDGKTGWLVPPNDGARLVEALIDALSDRTLTAQRGEAALRHARTRMDWLTPARQLGAMYHDMAGRPAPDQASNRS